MKPPSATSSLLRRCARCPNASPLSAVSARPVSTSRFLGTRSQTQSSIPQTRWISNGAKKFSPSQPEAAAARTEPSHSEETSPSQPEKKKPQTHYDLFPETLPAGPPPRGHFPIDVRALRREFLRLQAKAHPDLHPPERRAAAQGTSALINDAFKTLSNPLHRAQYLLSLRGIEAADDERGKVDDPGLLMEVMEAREEIEEAGSEEDLAELKSDNDARIAASEEVLERAFRDDDMASAVREVVRLRYWVNIKESLDNWEPGKRVEIIH